MSDLGAVLRRKYTSFVYRFCLRSFHFFERCGIHVTPVHYYSPIPDTGAYDEGLFSKEFSLAGVEMAEDAQLEFLSGSLSDYLDEYEPRKNTGLGLVDAYVLYTMIRRFRPKRVVEIGAGESTKIGLAALEKNREEGGEYRMVSVEPYPREEIRSLSNPYFELIDKKVENLDPSWFADADMLFIDSSHVSRIGGDVNFEILEIVPALKKGALVHWHDIPLPTNYWEDWAREGNKFWNETYMLHAFLQYNDSFSVLWASRFMRLRHEERLKGAFSFMDGGERCSSFWVRRCK